MPPTGHWRRGFYRRPRRLKRSFHERKAERRERFYLEHWKMKQRACTACAGSGRYDSWGSPPCGGCEGTGKEGWRSEADEVEARRLAGRVTG